MGHDPARRGVGAHRHVARRDGDPIRAGGYSTTSGTPRMRLLLDGTAIDTWPLAAGREWVAQEYVARVPTGFGWPTLRLQFTDLLTGGTSRRSSTRGWGASG